MHVLNRLFHLNERGSTVGREMRGAVATFLTMAYILFVNPSILAAAGVPKDSAVACTAAAAGACCILMGLYANFPIAWIVEYQAIARHERPGAVAEPDRGQPHAIQPGLIQSGLERGIRLVEGEAMESPHAFIGLCGGTNSDEQRRSCTPETRHVGNSGYFFGTAPGEGRVGQCDDYPHIPRHAPTRSDAYPARFGALPRVA